MGHGAGKRDPTLVQLPFQQERHVTESRREEQLHVTPSVGEHGNAKERGKAEGLECSDSKSGGQGRLGEEVTFRKRLGGGGEAGQLGETSTHALKGACRMRAPSRTCWVCSQTWLEGITQGQGQQMSSEREWDQWRFEKEIQVPCEDAGIYSERRGRSKFLSRASPGIFGGRGRGARLLYSA